MTDDGSADFYTTASYGTGTTETYTLTSGETTIFVRDFAAETIILNAIDANAAPGTSASIGIVPNTVGYYTFTIGTSQVAGTGFAGTVQAYDAYDNFAVNDSTTVFTLVDDGSADFYTSASYGTGTTETYTLTSGEVTIYVRDFVAETIVLNATPHPGHRRALSSTLRLSTTTPSAPRPRRSSVPALRARSRASTPMTTSSSTTPRAFSRSRTPAQPTSIHQPATAQARPRPTRSLQARPRSTSVTWSPRRSRSPLSPTTARSAPVLTSSSTLRSSTTTPSAPRPRRPRVMASPARSRALIPITTSSSMTP